MKKPSLWLVVPDTMISPLWPDFRILLSIHQSITSEKLWPIGLCQYNQHTNHLDLVADESSLLSYSAGIDDPSLQEARVRESRETKHTVLIPCQPVGTTKASLQALRSYLRQLAAMRKIVSVARKAKKGVNSLLTHRLLRRSSRIHNSSLDAREQSNHDSREMIITADDIFICIGCSYTASLPCYLFDLKSRVGAKVLHIYSEAGQIRSPWLYPPEYSAQHWENLANLLWCADSCLCLCEQVRDEISAFCLLTGTPSPPRLEALAYPLSPVWVKPFQRMTVKSTIGDSYILCVSSINHAGNQEVVYRAYQRLLASGYNRLPVLILVGSAPSQSEFLDELNRNPQVRAVIDIRQESSMEDLSRLYSGCLFTVFPSLCEDYPLPLIESMSHGKASIASDLQINRHVGGDLLTYVDPLNVAEWARHIMSYLDNPKGLIWRQQRILSSAGNKADGLTHALSNTIAGLCD